MTQEIFYVSLLFVGISFVIFMILKSKFAKYSKTPLANRFNGKQVAEKMLCENGICGIQFTASQEFLSDHYKPLNKTVNLSPEVYQGASISAAAVAAHECGCAVQHATYIAG